jgi:hypothetical protein
MVDETISRIVERIKSNESMSIERKSELLVLVGELKKEVAVLESTHAEDAGSIAGFAAASVHEATREAKKPELLEHSLAGLKLAAENLEVSHPQLVGLINTIGQALWNMGI